jgi:hypothetical protein
MAMVGTFFLQAAHLGKWQIKVVAAAAAAVY